MKLWLFLAVHPWAFCKADAVTNSSDAVFAGAFSGADTNSTTSEQLVYPRELRNPHPFQVPLDTLVDQDENHYHLGYKAPDFTNSWAKYYNNATVQLSSDFLESVAQPLVAPELGVSVEDAGEALNLPGYLRLENGFTTLEDGTMMIAVRSDIPANFTGEMYDFWFSWHINDTTKYKLWFPDAHLHVAIAAQDMANQQKQISYRERYWNVTSFVDEYVGSEAQKISVGFFDPRLLGFYLENSSTGVQTVVTGFIQPSLHTAVHPAQMAARGFGTSSLLFAHQVRRKPDGTGNEIRSRTWLGANFVTEMSLTSDLHELVRDMSLHCAIEMTHLGTFLPALFAEFKNDVPFLA